MMHLKECNEYKFIVCAQVLKLTDVIYRSSAELAIELLGTQTSEVMNCEGPEMQDIVPGKCVSLLYHHHFGPEESQLDRSPQATWTPSNYQALKVKARIIRGQYSQIKQ